MQELFEKPHPNQTGLQTSTVRGGEGVFGGASNIQNEIFLHVSPSCLDSDITSVLQFTLLPSWEVGNGLVWGNWRTWGHDDVVTRTSLWLIPVGTIVLTSLEDCIYKHLRIRDVNFFMHPFIFRGEGQSVMSQSSRHLMFLIIPSGHAAAQDHLSLDHH